MRYAVRAAVNEEGTELVEFALVLIPLLSFVFLIFSISWILFAQASLQYAVREGCRSAVTSSLTPDSEQQIRSTVQKSSFGFISPADVNDSPGVPSPITITPLPSGTGMTVVQIKVVENVPIIGGAFFNANSITLSAASSDAMESPSPGS